MPAKANRNNDNLFDYDRSSKTYWKEISKCKPLSRDEEYSLWERYKLHGDLEARDKIITSNLKFVARVVKPYQGLGLSYADLIGEGNCGFMKAIDKFDYKLGYKTISYSVWWIRQTILEALKKRNALKGDKLPDDSDQNDDTESMYCDGESVNDTSAYADTQTSATLAKMETSDVTRALMACLTDRESMVITKYFGLGDEDEMTLEEIGDEMGLTKERVRQIKEKAMRKMRSEALENSIISPMYVTDVVN